MEHIIVKDLGNGYVKLTAETGYVLKNTVSGRTYSEAVVKDAKDFVAVEA